MANPIKIFFKALFEKEQENQEEIKQAEKLGEIVSNNAEISVGLRSKIHVDAEKARKVATVKSKKKTAEKTEERM